MELIADSGSTTTTWCLIDDHGQRMEFQTVGMNPYFMTEEDICSVIKDELGEKIEATNPGISILPYLIIRQGYDLQGICNQS